jgi:MFS family permease
MTKKDSGGLFLMAAILAVGIQDIGGGAASPALADIMKAMPTVSPTKVMMISSIPAISQCVVNILFGKLCDIFRKKTLFHIASVLFLIGGLGPFWMNDINTILVFRVLLGMAIGIFVPLAVTLITDFYDDPKQINRMNGLNLTVACFGGMFFQTLGGYLARIDWHYCFLAYLFAFIVWPIVFFGLPEPERKAKQESEKVRLPGRAYGFALVYMIANGLLMAIVTNNAVAIVMNGYGDAATAGISLTLYTGGGFFGGILFGFIVRVLKKFSLSFGYLLAAVGFGIAMFATNAGMIILGTFVTGLSLGTIIPATYAKIQGSMPAAMIGAAIGVACAGQGIGQFFQAIVYAPILEMVGGPGKPAFGVSAVAFITLFVISVIVTAAPKEKKPAW